MIDPVIDEHFRRSLGADYMNLFGKKREAAAKHMSPASSFSPEQQRSPLPNQTKSATEPSQPSTPSSCSSKNKTSPTPKMSPSQNALSASVDVVDGPGKSNTTIAMSVDDHFAKALGDTWKQLQQAEKQIAASGQSSGQSDDDDEYFDDDMAADDDDNSSSSSTSTPIQRKKDRSRK